MLVSGLNELGFTCAPPAGAFYAFPDLTSISTNSREAAEILLDKDNKITRGKCTCSFFYQSGLRRGPCRHMQALRSVALRGGGTPSMEQWFEQMAMT